MAQARKYVYTNIKKENGVCMSQKTGIRVGRPSVFTLADLWMGLNSSLLEKGKRPKASGLSLLGTNEVVYVDSIGSMALVAEDAHPLNNGVQGHWYRLL